MADDKKLILTGEDARAVAELMLDYLGEANGPPGDLTPAAAVRIAARLDKFLGDGYHPGALFDDVPWWARQVLHQTYAPEPKPAKKLAKGKAQRKGKQPAGKAKPAARTTPSAAARSAATPAPFPPPRVRDEASAAPAAESLTGSSSGAGAGTVKLTGSAARRLGGLKRARQVAFEKGDNVRVSELDRKMAALQASVTAVVTHAGA